MQKYNVKVMLLRAFYNSYRGGNMSIHDMDAYNRVIDALNKIRGNLYLRIVTPEEHAKLKNPTYKYLIP